MAFGIFVSTTEILIPRLYEFPSMFFDYACNTRKFSLTKTAASLQPNGFEPELRNTVVSFHMHVTGFPTVAGVEEKPVWPPPQYRGH